MTNCLELVCLWKGRQQRKREGEKKERVCCDRVSPPPPHSPTGESYSKSEPRSSWETRYYGGPPTVHLFLYGESLFWKPPYHKIMGVTLKCALLTLQYTGIHSSGYIDVFYEWQCLLLEFGTMARCCRWWTVIRTPEEIWNYTHSDITQSHDMESFLTQTDTHTLGWQRIYRPKA